jgi:phosphomethylpyrimidine synthase
MNQIELAKKGKNSEEMEIIARSEGVSLSVLRRDIVSGKIAVLRHNKRKPERFCAVGKGLHVKVNVNIGTSPSFVDLNEEEKKIKVSEEFFADTIMDLSTGGDIDKIRKFILKTTILPVGTVPIYQAAIEAKNKYGDISAMTEDDFFNVIERQAEDGVDFMTVHCGVTKNTAKIIDRHPRITGIVSRGGAILYDWMNRNKKENPLFSRFDRLLSIAKKYDIVLSLGDGMRPGCLADASDKVQLSELKVLASLAKKALKNGVQVIIEGPGHVPLNQIEKNIKLQKKVCNGAPFYVLGPLVTDIAPGYDHITGAIGGTLAAFYGADYLCYVTPAEHLRLPTIEDVKDGLIASKIAAHAADIAKGIKGSSDRDLAMSKARAKRDWKKQIEISIDPEKAKRFRYARVSEEEDVCTMCGEFCSLKIMEKCKTRV